MADIPVNASDAVVIVDVVADGQVSFAYDFRVDEAPDLLAIYNEEARSLNIDLVGGTDFNVTGLSNPNGGNVTLTGFTDTKIGGKLTLYRNTVIKRLTDFTRDLFADPLNAEFDKVFMILQELSRATSETLRVEPGQVPPNITEVLAAIEAALSIAADLTATYARDGSRPLTGPLTTAGNRIVDLGTASVAVAPAIEFAAGLGMYATAAGDNVSFTVGGNHIGRFRSDGVHVGKFTPDIATTGASIFATGLVQAVRNADIALQVNRLGAVGTIAEFKAAGANVLAVNEIGIDVPLSGSATNTNIRFGYGGGHGIYSLANTNISFAIGGVHVGRFSSTGIHVTKFAADISQVGHSLINDGLLQSTRNGGVVAQLNRTGSDGTIAEFMNDGVVVASVATDGGHTARRFAGDIVLAQATTAQLTSISAAINTDGKFYGKVVLNTTINKLVVANGSGAGATWRNVHDGSTAHTPT